MVKCVKCNIEKLRINTYKKDTRGRNIYVSPEGKRGRMCNLCFASINTKTEPSARLVLTTKRKCRLCSSVLPSSRYFNCERCQPELPCEMPGHW